MEPLLSGDATLYLPYLIPVCGVCLWVYWASTDKDLQCRRLMVVPLIALIWFESGGAVWAQVAPPTATTTPGSGGGGDFPTITKTIEGVPVQLPDWSKISIDSLGGMLESGSVTIPPEIAGDLGFDKITWNAGDKLSDVLPTGALGDCLGLDKLTQGAIDKITGNVSSNLPLNDFKPVGLQNLGSLTEAVPNLGSQLVGNVLPIKDLIEQAIGSGLNIPGLTDIMGQINNVTQVLDTAGNVLGALQNGNVVGAAGQILGTLGTDGKVTNAAGEMTGMVNQAGQIVNQAGQVLGTVRSVIQSPLSLLQMPIGQLLQQVPQLGQLAMGNLDLSKYVFSQIPGLESTPIGRFMDWQKVLVNGIPGLAKVPFNQFPNPIAEAMNAFVARVDVPLDEKEAKHDAQKTVSGSYQQGFRVPCEKNCAQAELTPIAGSQMDKANMGAFSNGKSWISGKHQQVEGGEGVLKAVNGGKEPTGRNPYCSLFKQVVTKVDAPGGKVGTSMYFRVCKRGTPDLGCTPYFLGPIPFLSYKEKAFIYLGEANPKDDGGGIDVGGGSDDPLSAQDGFDDCGSKLSGEATTSATKAVDKVARSVNDGAFQQTSGKAKEHVERIMAEAQRQGITCPAQIAYILATAGGESTYGTNMGEFADTAMKSSSGTQYYGRGYVGLTHRENYAKATQYLRSQGINVDLVANPELASRPDIAAKVLVWGMRTGAFTGRKLGDYVNCNGRVDFNGARNVVNPGEGGARRANMATAAKVFYDALKDKDVSKDKATDTCGGSTQVQPCPPGQRCPLLNPLPHMSSTGIYSRFRGCRPSHNGVDIQSTESPGNYDRGIPYGGPVVAPDDGVVVYAANDGSGYANIVKIYHPQRGYSTFMAHLYKIMVKQGQQVKRGQQVAIEGGNGTKGPLHYGIHVHLEIHQGTARPGDPYGNRLNPESFEYEKPAIRKPGADMFCGR